MLFRVYADLQGHEAVYAEQLYIPKRCTGTAYIHLFILVINQIDAQVFLFYNKLISCLYMFRAYVLETCRDMKQTYSKTKKIVQVS